MLENPQTNQKDNVQNDSKMVAANSSRLYEEAAHIWKDVIGQDRSVPEGSLSRRQLDVLESRSDLPESEHKAIAFLNKNFDYISSIDGKNGSLSKGDIDVFCKSLNPGLNIEPYFGHGNGPRESSLNTSMGIGMGIAAVASVALVPFEMPLIAFVGGATITLAAIIGGTHYLSRKLYDSSTSPTDYYSQKRTEISRNGALEGLAKLY